MKIPQTLTGVGLVLGGALSSLIPVIGPTVAPYIVGSGVAVITKGSYDKVTRKKRRSLKRLLVNNFLLKFENR